MGTNRAYFLVDLFLFLYESQFIQTSKIKEARSFSFTFRNIDRNCFFLFHIEYFLRVSMMDSVGDIVSGITCKKDVYLKMQNVVFFVLLLRKLNICCFILNQSMMNKGCVDYTPMIQLPNHKTNQTILRGHHKSSTIHEQNVNA